MIILVEQITPRIQYAFSIVLRDLEGEVLFTTQENEFNDYAGFKLSYLKRNAPQHAQNAIYASGILEHTEYSRVKSDQGTWQNMPTLFAQGGGMIPFDIFSATFFLLTRYEEYWRFESDAMGRYLPNSSVLYQMDVLDRPIVEEWISAFQKVLLEKDNTLVFNSPTPKYISTIDVDSAFAYRHKGSYRTLGGVLKDLSRFDFKNLQKRLKTIILEAPDPYDTYQYLEEQHRKRKVRSIFFFLLADFGEFDKGLPHSSKGLRHLITKVSKTNEIGIHPGVASFKRYNTILKEKSRLESILGKQIKMSRQHYLMLKFRTTYRLLKSTGIEHDFTMGYAHKTGFRAGTCRPYMWFDLKKNATSNLMIHPFPAMDVTLKNYEELSIEEAKKKLSYYAEVIHRYNGEFITLWHNETVTNHESWQGWREVFEHGLDLGTRY
jgi:hypothetical protein